MSMKKTKIGKISVPRNLLITLIILIFSVSAILTGSVIAKYASVAKNDRTSVTAKKFYFESNYLTANNHVYKLGEETQSVTFELYNYENDLRVSEVGITYSVSVSSSDTSFTLNGDSAAEKKIEIGAEKSITSVTLGNIKSGYDYAVSVTADGGYTKTLGAIFSVAPASNGFFMNTDSSDSSCVILTVWSENLSGEVDIAFPAGLIPDTTDSILAGVHNLNGSAYEAGEVSDTQSFAQPYSSHAYRFFKTEDYNPAHPFTVKMGDIDAVESNIPE